MESERPQSPYDCPHCGRVSINWLRKLVLPRRMACRCLHCGALFGQLTAGQRSIRVIFWIGVFLIPIGLLIALRNLEMGYFTMIAGFAFIVDHAVIRMEDWPLEKR